MAVESKKWVEVTAKLIQLTQSGSLKWSLATGDFSVAGYDGSDSAFIASYKNKILRIYRLTYKVEDPGPGAFSTASIKISELVLGVKKYPYWTSMVRLEFVNSDGKTLWTFPDTNALEDLYSSVQYQVAGVTEFLDDILKDK